MLGREAVEEMAGEAQPLRDLRPACRPLAEQAGGQRQQPRRPVPGARPADGAAAAGADEGQILARAGDGAAAEIKRIAELVEELHFPAQIVERPARHRIADHREERLGRGEKRGVGGAFGQREGKHRAGGGQPGKRQPVAHRARARGDRFDGEGAELVLEPGVPAQGDGRAGLQRRRHLPRGAAAHHARMPAMGHGEDLDQRRGLALRAGREDGAVVLPVHAGGSGAGFRAERPGGCLPPGPPEGISGKEKGKGALSR
ncbi:hypothetical protein SDC9_34780 [bioreactor metagenome]|uniref:Uncharacterized protein n=1 Tax=bioreactor metagenome TaxID=1076179 RepID=A0A644VDG1_9ZZZZ